MVNIDVTCPETNLPERIGCLIDPTGEILVVLRCTRFDPPWAPACPESCRELAHGGVACSCHVRAEPESHYFPSPNG